MIEIKNRLTGAVIYTSECENLRQAVIEAVGKGADLRDVDLRDADLQGADLQGADLQGADLQGAYLQDAYLRGADLRDADLGGAKNYLSSHDFFAEIVRRQKTDTFTLSEWGIIGQVGIHRLCWDSIVKRFGEEIMPVFKKLAIAGFDEWEKHYQEMLEGGR